MAASAKFPGARIALDARLVAGRSTGDSTYWTGLLHGLAGLDSDLRYLLISDRPAPDVLEFGERFEWLHVPARSGRLWSLFSFPVAARKAGCELIHTQYNLSPLARDRGVTTIHDVSFLIGPQWFKPRDRLLLTRFVPRSAKRARRVITVSETSRADIERLVPEAIGKVTATPLAPGVGIKRPTPAQAAEDRRALGVDYPYVLSVGTRWPRKNASLAVAAVDALPPSLPHRLVLSGKAGWGAEEGSARLSALGYVSDRQLAALYEGASIFLMPSLYEGFGIPVLEAFLCGAPVLSSRGGSLPEVVGDAGVVAQSWDTSEWTGLVQGLLQDSSKLATLRETGFARAAQFSWRRTAELTEAVYRSII